jgi:hypothetical protein
LSDGRWSRLRPRSPPRSSLGSGSVELLAALNAEAPGRGSPRDARGYLDEGGDEEARQVTAEVPPWARPKRLDLPRAPADAPLAEAEAQPCGGPSSEGAVAAAVGAVARAVQARAVLHGAFPAPWEAALAQVTHQFTREQESRC